MTEFSKICAAQYESENNSVKIINLIVQLNEKIAKIDSNILVLSLKGKKTKSQNYENAKDRLIELHYEFLYRLAQKPRYELGTVNLLDLGVETLEKLSKLTDNITGEPNKDVANKKEFKLKPFSIFCNKLANMRIERLLTDCTITVNTEVVNAHKCILAARSGYFRDAFSNNNDKNISLTNISNKTFLLLLDFMYTGKFSSKHIPDDEKLQVYQELNSQLSYFRVNDLERLKHLLINLLVPQKKGKDDPDSDTE